MVVLRVLYSGVYMCVCVRLPYNREKKSCLCHSDYSLHKSTRQIHVQPATDARSFYFFDLAEIKLFRDLLQRPLFTYHIEWREVASRHHAWSGPSIRCMCIQYTVHLKRFCLLVDHYRSCTHRIQQSRMFGCRRRYSERMCSFSALCVGSIDDRSTGHFGIFWTWTIIRCLMIKQHIVLDPDRWPIWIMDVSMTDIYVLCTNTNCLQACWLLVSCL